MGGEEAASVRATGAPLGVTFAQSEGAARVDECGGGGGALPTRVGTVQFQGWPLYDCDGCGGIGCCGHATAVDAQEKPESVVQWNNVEKQECG